jgi:hypothetical protein
MNRIHRAVFCPLLLVAVLVVPALRAIAAPELQPGRVFHLEFPTLGPSEHAALPRVGVYLPTDYSTARKFPLLVWFGGGAGGDNPGPARQLAGDSGFICAALPYEKGKVWKTTWAYYEPMLRELERAVPNIHPRLRACAGFSSGGAAICFGMGDENPGFRDYFHAFMPGGAGWEMGDMSPLRGRPIFAFIGKNDTRAGGFASIETAARAARADLTYLLYDGGHEMPAAHLPDMRRWLIEKVALRDLPQLRESMRAATAAREFGKAFRAAGEIRDLTAPGTPEHEEALATIARVTPHGEELAQKILAAPLADQQRFVRDWQGCAFAGPVAAKCAEVAAAQLARILAQQPVSPAYLKKYLDLWDGFPAAADALGPFETFAAEALDKARSVQAPAARNNALRQFIETWHPAPSATTARELREELARTELAAIREIPAKATRKARLRDFMRDFTGTAAEGDARQLLESL